MGYGTLMRQIRKTQHTEFKCLHFKERKKLGSSDLPLWERFLQGPSEDIMRIFLMDTDEQEVTMDVSGLLQCSLL